MKTKIDLLKLAKKWKKEYYQKTCIELAEIFNCKMYQVRLIRDLVQDINKQKYINKKIKEQKRLEKQDKEYFDLMNPEKNFTDIDLKIIKSLKLC